MALLIQALVEIEIHPQPRRGLRLRRELVEKMLVNNHIKNSNSDGSNRHSRKKLTLFP